MTFTVCKCECIRGVAHVARFRFIIHCILGSMYGDFAQREERKDQAREGYATIQRIVQSLTCRHR